MRNFEIALEREIEVLGNKQKAEEWLGKMSVTLGHTPKDILSESAGLDQVLRHLHSVELALDTD